MFDHTVSLVSHNPPRFAWRKRPDGRGGIYFELMVDHRLAGKVWSDRWFGSIPGQRLDGEFITHTAAARAVEEAYRDRRWGPK